jgi:divalent metal cation (Fe/Co/Zn/Cd) transporter
MPFERAHLIMDEIERAIHAIQSTADATVHAEPFQGPDETIIDKVRMIVVNEGLRAPHNLEVHQSGSKYFIDFDVEYSEGSTFVEAHALALGIEEKIRNEIPSAEKVTIHLEEFLPVEGELTHATAEENDLCQAIETLVLSDRRIRGCSDIAVLKHASYLHVTLTCKLDSTKTLAEVHQIITQVEAQLYQNFPQVRRFMIHGEPV